ncbi:choline ABC transporter ATP-binding protein [Jiella sp. MQZ9-1]|uniref:Trimethylamine N-oxide transport system ATP-binding protein TmoW n=1 Tax=Jiella flava TaxID=2816857 RepID=A0A939G2I2_9HYPH|nr:choline ABC transporter ATP-binding protein [Jiella flava]MBO0664022.1 choline ABC transporter ATP-binding protein [Jiella flava]MCD2472594.1 choline ABC transporter ATP-binding protein [Jiella flava]
MTKPVVSFQNVSIIFGRNRDKALELADAGRNRAEIREETSATLGVTNASIDVAGGEIAVLMGLSGSGKSTLIRAVNGLAPVARGRVVVDTGREPVDPRDCSTKRLRELRRHEVAMVFQQFALLPWRTVVDNVALGLEFAGQSKSARRKRALEQLELVGLSDWANSRVSELSGGMQQRVGLARAFATDAPVLLMDEPFSALDPLIRTRLQDELIDLQQKLKKTIIFVSHDLDEAFKIGNRIAIMEGGRIVQIGTAQDIVLRPADDYVSDFVTHMNPLNVLTANDVMKPISEDDASPANVAAMADPSTPLKRIMESVSGGRGSVVVSRNGKILGQIGPQEIVDALQRHQGAA